MVVMSRAEADRRGLKPLARIVATGVSALSPEIMDAAKQVTYSNSAKLGLATRVSFTDSGWTCPNAHFGFLRSHKCKVANCPMTDFIR